MAVVRRHFDRLDDYFSKPLQKKTVEQTFQILFVRESLRLIIAFLRNLISQNKRFGLFSDMYGLFYAIGYQIWGYLFGEEDQRDCTRDWTWIAACSVGISRLFRCLCGCKIWHGPPASESCPGFLGLPVCGTCGKLLKWGYQLNLEKGNLPRKVMIKPTCWHNASSSISKPLNQLFL